MLAGYVSHLSRPFPSPFPLPSPSRRPSSSCDVASSCRGSRLRSAPAIARPFHSPRLLFQRPCVRHIRPSHPASRLSVARRLHCLQLPTIAYNCLQLPAIAGSWLPIAAHWPFTGTPTMRMSARSATQLDLLHSELSNIS